MRVYVEYIKEGRRESNRLDGYEQVNLMFSHGQYIDVTKFHDADEANFFALIRYLNQQFGIAEEVAANEIRNGIKELLRIEGRE